MSHQTKIEYWRLIGIRLLFPGFIIFGLLTLLLRACFGEPYPAPFMPSFSGLGILMISKTEAEEIVPKLTVAFSDQTTTQISVGRLMGDLPPSACRPALFMIVPNPYPAEPTRIGLKRTLHKWLALHLQGYHEPVLNMSWLLTDEVRTYFQHRLEKIYPTKTPVSLTIEIDRCDFTGTDFHKAKIIPASQNTLLFHEGS